MQKTDYKIDFVTIKIFLFYYISNVGRKCIILR